MTDHDASLVVCTRNRPGMLSDLLQTVRLGTRRPAEIVVIDQSDRPHPQLSREADRDSASIRYLYDGRPGVSRGRNLGARVARHELLVFADDDTRPVPSWWAAIVGSLVQAEERTVVTGWVSAEERTGDGAARGVPSARPRPAAAVHEGRGALGVLWSGNFAIRRGDLLAVGGFDERLGPGTRFPAAEDNDLALRLLDAGYRIAVVPEAELVHRAWRSERDLARLRWAYGRGEGAYLAKHARSGDLLTLHRLVRGVAGNVWDARRLRDARRSRQRLAYAAGMVVGAGHWWLTNGVSRR